MVLQSLCLPSYGSNTSPVINLSSGNLFYQEPSEGLSGKQTGLWVAKTESQSSGTTAHALDPEEIPVDPIHPIYNWSLYRSSDKFGCLAGFQAHSRF